MGKVELLAPAGNEECLSAAVQSGADTVYISGKNFGARSFADNFDESGLMRASDYCHLHGVKLYVTVNTLVSDLEMRAAEEYLRFLSRIGTDAIIVQDFGIAETAKQIVPDLPVHASTQMTIHNSSGVKFAQNMGIKRVVLSRELSIGEIEKIYNETNAELEVFGHGALCMCYSGQCLMSSIIGGRSGNRGKCAQPCRLMYSVGKNRKKAFYMSLKDLCSLEHTQKMSEIGVASLKIEGRMKGAAYVSAVTSIYRKYIDYPQPVKKEDIELLGSIFYRGGLTDGYLTGKKGKNMFAFDKPDNPYLKGKDSAQKLFAPNTNKENRKKTLSCRAVIKEGEYPRITVSDGKTQIEYIYEKKTETAKNRALDAEFVRTQLTKTGGTPFEFENIDAETGGNAFMTAKDINALRRGGLERFEEKFLQSFCRGETEKIPFENTEIKRERTEGYVCEVTTRIQLDAALKWPFEKFYIPLSLAASDAVRKMPQRNRFVIVLPSIIHEQAEEKYISEANMLLANGYDGVLIQNPSLIGKFGDAKLYGGFRLNIFNSRALGMYADMGLEAAELSPELNLAQIRDMKKPISVQTMVYGRLPLMITENCVLKNGNECPCGGIGYITDRMEMKFPVIRDGDECRSVVLNCKKTFMAEDMKKIEKTGVELYRIYFTDETAEECRRVCGAFFEENGYKPEEHTAAHYYKGVM